MGQWATVFTRNKKVMAFTAIYILVIALLSRNSAVLKMLLNTPEIPFYQGKLIAFLVMMFVGICCAILVDEPLALGVISQISKHRLNLIRESACMVSSI